MNSSIAIVTRGVTRIGIPLESFPRSRKCRKKSAFIRVSTAEVILREGWDSFITIANICINCDATLCFFSHISLSLFSFSEILQVRN